MKKVSLALALVLLSAFTTYAHTVVWLENPSGIEFLPPPINLDIYPADLFEDEPPNETISIMPDYEEFFGFPSFEPCTVFVNVDPPQSPLLGIEIRPNAGIFDLTHLILPTLPALEVDVVVYLKDLPKTLPTGPIQTGISGEWHASGLPPKHGCDAIKPNPFFVPININFAPEAWALLSNPEKGTVDIDTKKEVALQVSDHVNGPYVSVGVGHLFSLAADAASQFYRGVKKLSGGFVGSVTDATRKPQTGLTVTMPGGGRSATTDTNGVYVLRYLPFGDNLLQFIKSVTLKDPDTGQSSTGLATFDIVVPVLKAYGALDFKIEAQVFKIPICNCTPWCSIGFGTLDGENTPIYFSGGANLPPKGTPPSCDAPVVTVTPPNGKTFTIKPGGGKHQNSGPSPAPGTWTVTTTICGQSKSCSITYP